MKPDSDQSPVTDDGRNHSSTEWTPSIIDDSDFEGRSSSSTLSWTDEADCTIAEQLKLRYEQFEAALYSEVPSDTLTASERAEKEIWNEYTPHLRVTGKKINLIRPDYSTDDGPSRSGSPGLEEIIVQHPEVASDLGNSRKSSLTRNERSSSCRSVSCKTKEGNIKEDPAIKEKMAKAVAEKLLEQAWPNAKKVGLVPKTTKSQVASNTANALSRPQYSAESDSSFKENSHSFTVLPSKDIRRVAQPDLSLKPINFQSHHPRSYCRAKSSHLESSDKSELKAPLSRNARNLSSARHSRRKPEKQEHETESMSDDNPLDSPELTGRHGFLPPIDSLTVTPKLPSKRANSAMLRFTKIQPRTRPTTSRSKSLFLAPIKSFSVCSSNSKFAITPIAENSPFVFSSQLPHCSSRKMNKRANPPRWRY